MGAFDGINTWNYTWNIIDTEIVKSLSIKNQKTYDRFTVKSDIFWLKKYFTSCNNRYIGYLRLMDRKILVDFVSICIIEKLW